MTKLTPAQLAVVQNVGDHLLVDAGAGSGKTTTVVQAICHQLSVEVIVDGAPLPKVAAPLTFDEVAAITFTNQAAADLKRKLRAALRSAGRRDLGDEVDSARIGTIHGFCGDLLNEFALRGGTRPGRQVIEPGEASALLAECARDALRLSLDRGDVHGLDTLLTGRRLKHVSEWVTQLAEDSDRLARYELNRKSLREHECALLDVSARAATLRLEALDRDGTLDFDRMIVATRDLLRIHDIRRAVQQRVRLLVLDEFQDVDPAQRDIALLLGGLEHADANPTRIVLVGDPKQSIYRFRRADVTLWNTVAARFESGAGKVLPLTENFRSKAAILGMVDHVVGKKLNVAIADDGARRAYEVAYAPLAARADGAEGDHAVELLVVLPNDEGKAQKADDVRALDAAAVAQRIGQLRADGTALGDIAILLAGWAAVDMYVDALHEAGIPCYVLRGEGFWDTREVLDCLLALRAIRDNTDDVAMVGFLKSPFVGVRDDTLLALARQANGASLATALASVECERELLARANVLLSEFSALRDRLSVHDLLVRLLERSGFVAAVALNEGGAAQSGANLRKLVRLAAAVPDQSLGDFLRVVAEERSRESQVDQERLYRERSDVVTITSIHSAKGLEWDVVFWADLVRELSPRKEKCLLGRETFAVKIDATDGEGEDIVDAAFKAFGDELQKEALAEAYRLWYVASTRAKKLLVLSGVPLGENKRKAVSPASVMRESFPSLSPGTEIEYRSHHGVLYHAQVTACDVADQLDGVAPETDAPALTVAPPPVFAPTGSRRLSASQLMAFAHDGTRWWSQYVDRFDGMSDQSLSRVSARAIATGLIVHDVLERIDTDDVEFAELIDEAIAARDTEAPAADSATGIAYRAHIQERVTAALSSPAWTALAAAPTARRELAFTRILAGGTTISGAIDLAASIDGTARLLDVKTSSASGSALAERYAVQAAVYSDAVRVIGGVEDVSFTLLTVPKGEATEVNAQVDVADLVARVRGWRNESSD